MKQVAGKKRYSCPLSVSLLGGVTQVESPTLTFFFPQGLPWYKNLFYPRLTSNKNVIEISWTSFTVPHNNGPSKRIQMTRYVIQHEEEKCLQFQRLIIVIDN